ncbi:MAG: glycogen debranching enzyme family protein, partial [Kiritimatiellae bacterium]|nr:glycogen debranching enzyme family protein [Kiritimatiellia bacterium]
AATRQRGSSPVFGMLQRQRRVMAMRTLQWLDEPIPLKEDGDSLAARFIQDPVAFTKTDTGLPRAITMQLPADLHRDVMVPPGKLLYIASPVPFRAQLRNTDGEVVSEGRAIAMIDGGYGVMLPVYRTYSPIRHEPRRTEHLKLSAEIYTPSGVESKTSSVFALAEGVHAGLLRRRFSGPEVNALGDARLLLTNGTGAMGQIRLKWGDIRSQYDCLLALNRHTSVPDDRQVFFTRCRAWINCNDYSAALSEKCLEHVTIAPDGSAAEWRFAAPCGMGRRVPITLRVALEPVKNRVVLRFRREKASKPWRDPDVPVRLILRPDIEWRNFHCKTKAYTGLETAWPKALVNLPNGFGFRPEANTELAITLPKGEWHPEAEWTYSVSHPEEAARGQEASSDLWSPGWFHVELKRGEEAILTAGIPAARTPHVPALARALPSAPLSLREGMAQALRNYIVRRDAHKTVIAGYPWFLDWGRDTLIFLRGVVAAKDWDTVFDTLTEFGRFEKGGTIPNMIRGEDDANRETVDAPLWFAVIVDDMIAHHGAEKILTHPCGKNRTLKDVLVSIAENYVKGTVNGIKADPETGLIWAPNHYTWMDTNYPAGTPRNGYSVEIQALWVRLLDLLGREVAPKWKRLANKVRRNFVALFPLPDGGLSDCLYAEQGVSAKAAEQDDAIRPNQLYAVTLGLLKANHQLATSVLKATECLLSPGAIRTLADRPVSRPLPIYRDGVLLNNPHNPYWGRYEGDEDTRRKPAYHNGTGWTFPFPLYA